MEPEAFKAPRLLLLYHNVLRHFFIDSHSGIFNMDDHVSAKLRDHPNLASIHKTKVCQEPSCISGSADPSYHSGLSRTQKGDRHHAPSFAFAPPQQPQPPEHPEQLPQPQAVFPAFFWFLMNLSTATAAHATMSSTIPSARLIGSPLLSFIDINYQFQMDYIPPG